MRTLFSLRVGVVCLLACTAATGSTTSESVAATENTYADLLDAYGAFSTIASGLMRSYEGKDRDAWQATYRDKRNAFVVQLSKLPSHGLSVGDARAVKLMGEALHDLPPDGSSLSPTGKCKNAQTDIQYDELRAALYSCFDELGNNLQFDGETLNRVSALSLLELIKEPEKRKNLFLAFSPLWAAVNSNDQPDSPYRRMIKMASMEATGQGSTITAAADSLGVRAFEVENWLEQILDAWRQATGDAPIEPWDYRYADGESGRLLDPAIPRESLQAISERYYHDLGADLKDLGVLYDLDARPGKAPLAYTDLLRSGRMVNGSWRPAIARISANYGRGGLANMNELVHEEGHAVHFVAVRSRPAFTYPDSSLFIEAFADVPSWSVYEPAWQQKYLGTSSSESASLRSLYSGVMLDLAWALFEIRMLHKPAADPNAVWTDITSRYLHILPHPENSWWAVRVQLVDSPGYMVNYGLGAVITAELRHRIRESLGPFETGDPRWYPWISEHLLRVGGEYETAELLRRFLGRGVSPQALIDDIRRLARSQESADKRTRPSQ
jgi:Peptidase family M3